MLPLFAQSFLVVIFWNDPVGSFQLTTTLAPTVSRQHRIHHHHRGAGDGAYRKNLLFSSSTALWASQPPSLPAQRDPGLTWTSVVSHPQPVDGPHGIPSRAQQLQRLKQQQQSSSSSSSSSPPTCHEYDVLVVGGGATGAGVALDAAARGLSTACIERGDFASETSSRSTKLIWAGLKYMATAVAALLSIDLLTDPVHTLQNFVAEMNLVLHCHQERRYMLEKQAHLVKWMPIAVPFTRWIDDPPPLGHPLFRLFPIMAPAVFKLYDALSLFTCPPSYILTKDLAMQKIPQLDAARLQYCAVFYEGQHNDARTNLAIAMSAAEQGAHIVNYVEMIDVLRLGNNNNDCNGGGDDDDDSNKIVGIVALDRMTGEQFEIRAKHIVLAGGPFTEELLSKQQQKQMQQGPATTARGSTTEKGKADEEQKQQQKQKQQPPVKVQAAYGSHIVLPGHFIPRDMGMLDYNTSDGRFLFIAPWLGHTLVGTTDKKGPAGTLNLPPEEDIQWLLQECQKYLRPDLQVQRSDVLSAWRGWRPLVQVAAATTDSSRSGSSSSSHVSRDHVIVQTENIYSIVGGKWTTWREMAQDVVDQIVKTNSDTPKCCTQNLLLYGGQGYSKDLPNRLMQDYGIESDIAQHLVDTYGGRAVEVLECGSCHRLSKAFPYIAAEVVFACREYACTIEDILSRRTRLACLNKEAAMETIPVVADIMRTELGWTSQVHQEQIKAALTCIDTYGGPVSASEEMVRSYNVTYLS